ncbi:Co2+/Mg2+ efflux protein ApaG [Zoogloea sp.]|uniref:Co2+/Mg2+ efflux protein ApaG n=1 Tax=Zoogloea sp. TaxID=49181 RepID=UPI00260A616E|nr:Co2+/Mg2+ efflux protein ApaG [Zoogloea sp.]MDD3352480.1 Co2+/Mg2+ efflux protein ApaG [Zoogloea sp.]
MTSTQGNTAIEVRAVAQFIEEQSHIEADRYAFAYRITLLNTGDVTAQLLGRHWIISDAQGHIQEVEGSGVVGQQPVLRPGESFEYTSGCTIATPVGTMKGSYQFVNEDGRPFDVPIPEFTLAMPRILH